MKILNKYQWFPLIIHFQKESGSAIDQMTANFKHTYSAISSIMQTVINDAWENAAPSELREHYTARVSVKTGTPNTIGFHPLLCG